MENGDNIELHLSRGDTWSSPSQCAHTHEHTHMHTYTHTPHTYTNIPHTHKYTTHAQHTYTRNKSTPHTYNTTHAQHTYTHNENTPHTYNTHHKYTLHTHTTHTHIPHLHTPHKTYIVNTHIHLSFGFWEMASRKGLPYSRISWNNAQLYLFLMTEEPSPSVLPTSRRLCWLSCSPSDTHGMHSPCSEMIFVSKCPHCAGLCIKSGSLSFYF